MVASHIVSFPIALGLRIFLVFTSGFVALIAIDAWQDHMLPSGTSFDVVFDRLEWAIYGASAASIATAAALVFWQALRFSLAERIALSCLAVGLVVTSIAIVNGAI